MKSQDEAKIQSKELILELQCLREGQRGDVKELRSGMC